MLNYQVLSTFDTLYNCIFGFYPIEFFGTAYGTNWAGSEFCQGIDLFIIGVNNTCIKYSPDSLIRSRNIIYHVVVTIVNMDKKIKFLSEEELNLEYLYRMILISSR